MSYWIDADVPGDYRAAGLADNAGPWLVIHVDALELSDEELGRVARACADSAFYAEACERGEQIISNGRNRNPGVIGDREMAFYELLFEYRDRSQRVAEAFDILERARVYRQHRAAKSQKRREIQNNYDRLFVQIGRRDGFRCAHCGTDKDLTIDHIVALAVGGSNDLDNLQLLCGPCNSRKGTG